LTRFFIRPRPSATPLDVVRDTDMTVAEKRSVLASWASDACAIEYNPALRASATANVVSYDDIIDALQSLDPGQSADTVIYAFKRQQRRRRRSDWKGRRRGGPDNGDVGSSAFGLAIWMGQSFAAHRTTW
jgi:hypothetical protein